MNEQVDTKVDPPAPATQPTSKAKQWGSALGWAVAGTVIPVGAAVAAAYVFLDSLPDDPGWSALSVLYIVPIVYLILLFVIAGLGAARSRTLKDGTPRGTAVFLLPVLAIAAGVVLNLADGVQDSIEQSNSQSGAVNNALDDLTVFPEENHAWRESRSGEPPALANCETEIRQSRRVISTTSEQAAVVLDEVLGRMNKNGNIQQYQLVNDVDVSWHAVVKREGILLDVNAVFDGAVGKLELVGTESTCVVELDPIPDGATLGWPNDPYESTPENVELHELLMVAELPDSVSLLYQAPSTMNILELCPNGTSTASDPSGRDGDIDGWLDAQADSFGEAGFETREIALSGRSLNDPNSTTHALLAVNGSAALILEAESREGFDIYHSQIIVGSCVEQLGLGLVESISRFTENGYVEILDE